MLFVRSYPGMWLLAGLLSVSSCLAQQPQPPAPDGGASGMTLHVTVKELQVAALVLDLHRKPVVNVEKGRFQLQVDTDKPFLPTTVHREGDDPISMAIVIDVSHSHWFHAQLAAALAEMRANVLLPHDRLYLFAVDCSMVSYRGETATPQSVKEAVEQILANPRLHIEGKPGRTCEDQLHLWDSSLLALRRLATAPGRHAMLLVSDGRDNGSTTKLPDLARFCTVTATTLFTLPSTDLQGPAGPRNPLEVLAARTGGKVLDPPSRKKFEQTFTDLIELMRERYILGFNQPQHAKPGEHSIQTLLQHSGYVIRTSGVSVPLSDKDGTTTTVGQDASTDDPAKP